MNPEQIPFSACMLAPFSTGKFGGYMKTFSSLVLALSVSAATGLCSAQVVSDPSVVLPPAEVILNACKDMGVEAVDGNYALSKIDDAINKTGKVFFIDARPARTYDDGFIPTAFNMYDAKFSLIYPQFEKLNIPKDTEILIGIGRPCTCQDCKRRFFKKIMAERPSNVSIVDVRTAFEYKAGHFENDKHIFINDLYVKGCDATLAQLPKEGYVVFVCATGARAGEMYSGIKDECKYAGLKRLFFLDANVDFTPKGPIVR